MMHLGLFAGGFVAGFVVGWFGLDRLIRDAIGRALKW